MSSSESNIAVKRAREAHLKEESRVARDRQNPGRNMCGHGEAASSKPASKVKKAS